MTTRPRSSSRFALAAFALALVVGAPARTAYAQPRPVEASEESQALRDRYDFARWAPSGESRAGVSLSRFTIAGLALRARTDQLPREGGITLSFGLPTRITLVVRLGVVPDAAAAREALLAHLRGAQAILVPLRDGHGADVAFGDSSDGVESAAVVFGNIVAWIARTSDAGSETPSAASVVLALRSALQPGSPVFSAPTLSSAQGAGGALRVGISGGVFDHVEARVRGGHVRGPVGPSGLDVVPGGRGAVEVRVVATDALGRSGQAVLAVSGAPIGNAPRARLSR